MKASMFKLLNAQEIDLEIDKLLKSKNEYPHQIEILKKEISDLETAVNEIENRITENKKKRLLIEEEITAERDILSRKEKRLLETKTNKEYTAVQHEIENARERIDHLETEDLELMTEIDTLIPNKDELMEKYKTALTANTTGIDEIQNRFDSIESNIEKMAKRREAFLNNIDKKVLNVYLRLRKGKSGIAVATVDQNKLSCKGCFKQLPPQKVLEVRRAQQMIFCESCGRILVWDSREEKE